MIALTLIVAVALICGASFSSDALVIALGLAMVGDSIRSNRMSAKDVLVEDIKARIAAEEPKA